MHRTGTSTKFWVKIRRLHLVHVVKFNKTYWCTTESNDDRQIYREWQAIYWYTGWTLLSKCSAGQIRVTNYHGPPNRQTNNRFLSIKFHAVKNVPCENWWWGHTLQHVLQGISAKNKKGNFLTAVRQILGPWSNIWKCKCAYSIQLIIKHKHKNLSATVCLNHFKLKTTSKLTKSKNKSFMNRFQYGTSYKSS